MSKIAHFSALEWEKNYLREKLPQHEHIFFEEKTLPQSLEQIQDCQAISVFIYDQVGSEILEKLPNLKLILTRSTGFDHIDLEKCKSQNIAVCNVPSYGENTIAEHAFALLLALARKVPEMTARSKQENFEFHDLEGFDLHGKTLGVIGSGKIGLHAIKIARGFGMKVIAFDVFKQEFLSEVLGFEYLPLEEILAKSDILSLHAPYNKHTHHMLNRQNISLIKKGTILINTSRGALVENEALWQALEDGTISAAGLDVLEGEGEFLAGKKGELSSKILTHERVLFTPHAAFYTREAAERILNTTIANLQTWESGKAHNVVNS